MKKRKDFDLDLPPTKSRRLEAESYSNSTTMEEDPPHHIDTMRNEERAVVLYDPPHSQTPFIKSPTSPLFSILVNSHFIPGLKDYLFSRGTTKLDELGGDEAGREKSSEVSKDCLAGIPWVAFHSPMACEEIVPETGQHFEAEEGEMMEMDEPHVNNNNAKAMEIGEKVEVAGASSPWQQQHCMMLNMLQKTNTPIHWC